MACPHLGHGLSIEEACTVVAAVRLATLGDCLEKSFHISNPNFSGSLVLGDGRGVHEITSPATIAWMQMKRAPMVST